MSLIPPRRVLLHVVRAVDGETRRVGVGATWLRSFKQRAPTLRSTELQAQCIHELEGWLAQLLQDLIDEGNLSATHYAPPRRIEPDGPL